jgi:hypothetical protein
MTYSTVTTRRLTKLLHFLGHKGEVLRSDNDTAGRYLWNWGGLPLVGLGWTRDEASEAIKRL